MTKAKILLVDDERALVSVLQPVLLAEGFSVTVARKGKAAISSFAEGNPDLVLLDLGLPDVDGKAVIRAIRQSSQTPIIVISARHQEKEKIAALDEGADDYVNKPFKIGELMARIRAALRRSKAAELAHAVFESGPLKVDFTHQLVEIMGERVRLSRKEYALLEELALNAGKVITHKRLLAVGWGSESADSQYLRIYIGLLRQKIEENPSDPRLLVTESGIGYRLSLQH